MNDFFYIMVLTHNLKVGFGITGTVNDRIQAYIAMTAELQAFKYMYYGPKADIEEVERMLKAEWKRYLWTVFKGNKWDLEVLDPVHNLTAEDVKKWVDAKIKKLQLPIREVKDIWLPYQGDKRVSRKFINLNPNMYLKP